MTVSTTNNRVSYAGNGVTTVFSFPNKFLADADLVVLDVLDSTGAETTKTLTTHYTVSGAGDAAGGSVTMLTAPAAGHTLVIYRDPALTQPIDLVNGDPLNVETGIERGLDRLVTQVQRVRDLLDRSLHLPDGDTGFTSDDTELPPAVERASKFMAFDAAGAMVATAGIAGTVVVSPFMQTVVDDTTKAAAAATLGLSDSTDTALGDALVAGKRTDTGAVAFTQHAYNENRDANVKTDFGASVDGVADDATEINAALTAQQTVRLGNGTSLCAASVTPPANATLVGNPQENRYFSAAQASILKSSATKIIDCGTGARDSIRLRGLQLIPVTNLVAGSYGIYGVEQTFLEVTDVDIRRMDTAVYQEKSQQQRYVRPYFRDNNYGMLFYAAAGTWNTDWWNNVISIQDGTIIGSILGPNIDFQGQGLNVKNTDITGIPTSGTRASVRIRAGSRNVTIEDCYFEPYTGYTAGGDVFLCEGGYTVINNSHVQGGATGTRVGSIVSASGGAIVVVNGIEGFDYFTNLIKADGAGTIVYLMPGSLQGAYTATTNFSETNGGKIIDLRDTVTYGQFTATLTGCTTSPTGTVDYVQHGKLVTLRIPSITGTSNTTAASLTGLPASLYPATATHVLTSVLDNGASVIGTCNIGITGNLTMYKGAIGTAFTAAGQKGWHDTTITYSLS